MNIFVAPLFFVATTIFTTTNKPSRRFSDQKAIGKTSGRAGARHLQLADGSEAAHDETYIVILFFNNSNSSECVSVTLQRDRLCSL